MAKKRARFVKQVERDAPDLPPLPPMRAWHVITGNGGDTTVTAHDCHTYDGVLTFDRLEQIYDEQLTVLVRAFGRMAWKDVSLVEVQQESHGGPNPEG